LRYRDKLDSQKSYSFFFMALELGYERVYCV